MLFLNFLNITIDPRRILQKELAIPFTLSVLVMPLITHFGFSRYFSGPYRIGLLLTACAPAGVMTLVLIHFIREKDYDLAFSYFFFSTFGSILYIPVVLKLLLGQAVTIEIRPFVLQTAALILIPFLSARLSLRFVSGKIIAAINTSANLLNPLLVFLVVSASISSASDELHWDLTLLGLSIAVIAIFMLPGGVGYLLGKMSGARKRSNTLALISSSRNCQFVLAVAILNFPPLTAVPIIIAAIFHHLTNAFWLWVLEK